MNRAHTRHSVGERTRMLFNLLVLFRAFGPVVWWIVRFSCIQLLCSFFFFLLFFRRPIVIHFTPRARARTFTQLPNRKADPNEVGTSGSVRHGSGATRKRTHSIPASTRQLINKRAQTVLELLCNLRSTEADVLRITVERKKREQFLFLSLFVLCVLS